MAHNEAGNIASLLYSLLNQRLQQVEIDEILVVSSGSTDQTDMIVREIAQKYDKVKLYTQHSREGKASAINLFLQKAQNDILMVISADTIPFIHAVERLIRPFQNLKIGMTGGRAIPTNQSNDLVGYAVNLLWKLHHEMAKFKPKLGEMVAFRRVFDSIPVESAVDEASIEALITSAGLKCLYISDAIVQNQGPKTILDFIKQRKRIAIGHLWLKKHQQYNVTSNQYSLLCGLYVKECLSNPGDIFKITHTASLELYSRLLGHVDYYLNKSNPFIWDIVESAKHHVSSDFTHGRGCSDSEKKESL